MSEPGDDSSFGPPFDGDSFGSGHSSTPDRRAVVGPGTGQAVGKLAVGGMDGCLQNVGVVLFIVILRLGRPTRRSVRRPFAPSCRG